MIKSSESVIFVDYQGIKATEETALRKEMRDAGADYIVAKNRLLRFQVQRNLTFEMP